LRAGKGAVRHSERMAKGIDLEVKIKAFLQSLFEDLGFPVLEARQQQAGTQNGFDIRITFLDAAEKKREFYFECKDYTSSLPWNELLRKVHELHASGHHADGFIGISPRRNLSNTNANVQHTLPGLVKFPVRFWTPDAHVQEYLSLDATLYQDVYGEVPPAVDREKTTNKLRLLIGDMLRERDEFLRGTSFPKDLTSKIPKIHADDIVGRTEELQVLQHSLFQHKQTVLVNGLGGIGKTTLAQAYLSAHYQDYQHVAWVTQRGADMTQDIAQDEGLLRSLSVSREGKDIQQVFYEILYKFKTISNKPNLLVLDNADRALTAIKDMLPAQPDWHLLVTSRERIDGFHTQEIGFLSPTAALALFKKHCSRLTDDTHIHELLVVVDYHTLTLEILAKTAQLRRVDIDTLKTAIERDLRANVYIAHKSDKVDRVRSYLSSIFTLSRLTENEIWLMKYFACLPAEYHAYETLRELIAPEKCGREDVFSETLAALADQGWLLYNTGTDSYKMHRIITEVAARTLPLVLADVEPLVESVSAKLQVNQFGERVVEKFPWIPFGRTLVHAFLKDTSLPIATLRVDLATVLSEYGDYTEARTLTERAIAIVETLDKSADLLRSQCYSCLGHILHASGDYAGAIQWFQKAIVLAEQFWGMHDPLLVMKYSSLAMVFHSLDNDVAAKQLLEKCVFLAEKNFGENHTVTADQYFKLGRVLLALGDHASANTLFEKSLHAKEKHLGADHPELVMQYSGIATMLQKRGDHPAAITLFRRIVASTEGNVGPDHPDMAVGLSELASALEAAGNYREAHITYERALEIAVRCWGAGHPNTLQRYTDLGTVLQAMGRYTDAKILIEKVIALKESIYGPEHPSMADSLVDLASILHDQHAYADAKKLYQKAIGVSKRKLGKDHPDTAMLYANFSATLAEMKDLTHAREWLEKAIHCDEKNFGPDHLTTIMKYANLAALHQRMGDGDAAILLLEKVLRSTEKILGEDHPSVALHYSNLGAFLHHHREDYDRAKALLEKAVASDEKNFGEHHPATAEKYASLGRVLEKLGHYARASDLLEKAIRVNTHYFGENSPKVGECYAIYANILLAMNDSARARDFLTKAAYIYFKLDRADTPNPEPDEMFQNILAMIAEADDQMLRAFIAQLDVDAKEKQIEQPNFETAAPTASQHANDDDDSTHPYPGSEEYWETPAGVDTTALSWLNDESGAFAVLSEHTTDKTLEQTLVFIKQKVGANEKALVWHYTSLIDDLSKTGNFEQANEVAKKTIPTCERLFGVDNVLTMVLYRLQANALFTLGEFNKGEALYRKVIAFYEKEHGPNDEHTQREYKIFSGILAILDKHEEAETFRKKCNDTE
jgi:tetratricopeptide (TPR) repeat protein